MLQITVSYRSSHNQHHSTMLQISFLFVLFANIIHAKDTSYDCSKSDSWVIMPLMPASTAESVSCVYDDKLYVAGEANTETFVYDLLANTWSENTAAKRLYAGNHDNGMIIDSEWWLIGGIDADGYGKVQVYNFSDNTWSTRASLPWDGGSVCATYINGVIYACGGVIGFDNGANHGGTNTTNLCAKYNVASDRDEWEMLGVMPKGVNHAATSVKNL